MNHTQRKPIWQLIITALHWAAYIRRCELCCRFLMFLHLILKKNITLYLGGHRILLITVFIGCIFFKWSVHSNHKEIFFFLSPHSLHRNHVDSNTGKTCRPCVSLQKQCPEYIIHRYQNKLLHNNNYCFALGWRE